MVDSEDVRDEIISILTAGDPQNKAGKSITKWLEGEPPTKLYPKVPWGWVECVFGPVKPGAALSMVTDNFYVVVVDKNWNQDTVENSILQFEKTVRAVLDADHSLNNKVAMSYVVNREKEKFFSGDYSMVALRITLYTRRRE